MAMVLFDRAGVFLFRRADARAEARASSCRRFVSAWLFRSAMALAGVPRRLILNFGEESCRIASRRVGGKGAFCIPGFGAMSSFWFGVGMFRDASIAAERSWRVAEAEREKLCGVPW